MVAIHIRTFGFNDEDAKLIEQTLLHLSGVAAVVVAKSMHLTSVLYEESLIGWKAIVRAIRELGFEAVAVRPLAHGA